jgi:L-ascorbate metabolism protein UlaG (beta-lactamase superfamily)
MRLSVGAPARAALAALLVSAIVAATQAPPPLTITFLANEGVHLAAGDKAVLVDALFESYGPEFALPADSTRAALAAARPPFHDVDLLLVTHRHGDHFHPSPVAAHLRANAAASLLTSRQVIESLRQHPAAATLPSSRLLSPPVARGARQRHTVNGIDVELLGLPHGGNPNRVPDHLGYVVELGGKRVLHVGDTDISEAAFRALRLDTARIDVALLPDWMITSAQGRETIARWIKPRRVVGIHLSARGTAAVARRVREALPGAMAFEVPLSSIRP